MAVTEIRTLHNGAKIYECASSDIVSLPAAPVDSCAVVTDSPGLLMIVDASGDWQQAPQTSRDFAGAPGRVGTLASVDAVRTCQQITNSGEITGFVVLTQAEYDALPASKLTDGKVYLVEEE